MVNSQCGLQQSSNAQFASHLPSARRHAQSFGDESEERAGHLRQIASPLLRRVRSQPVLPWEVGAASSGVACWVPSLGGALSGVGRRTSVQREDSFGVSVQLTPPSTPTGSGKRLETSLSGHTYGAFWDFSVGAWAPHQPEKYSEPPQPAEGRGSVSRGGDNAKMGQLETATWTMLHTIAAQFPEVPTAKQQKDVNNLIESLARVFPCASCAEHFQEILRNEPPVLGSGPELQRWMNDLQSAVKHSSDRPALNYN